MNITKYLSLLALTLLAMLAFYGSPVNACSCLPAHPQTHYCTADYVILARILRKSDTIKQNYIVYKIKILKTYKINEEGEKMLKHSRISTADNSAACGANLEIGKLYVIAGKAPHLNLCNFISEYKLLTTVQRRGILGLFAKGCKCEVKPCWGENCLQKRTNPKSCVWSPFAKCETPYSACLPKQYKTPEGNVTSCGWRKTPKYQACMHDP